MGQAIRTERYRLVKWVDNENPDAEPVYELYDYESDPLETRNHADTQPEVVKELLKILDQHPEPKPVVTRGS